ncbi:hypothetical protein AB1Y20_005762 [Prymnesium parvum]|uniref:Ribosomal oxygenase 2 n=1 Tax=Prymnesium parvum TaxID=97485 RepID=A0AB34J0Q1_PRYPA
MPSRFLLFLPLLARATPDAPVDLDAFYSNVPLPDLRAFLGPSLHFHHGLRLPNASIRPPLDADAAAARALDDAIRVLYPHIPLGATVLDVGAGWCGPAALLSSERRATVRGLTISLAQAEFCTRVRGFPTLHADVEAVDVAELVRLTPPSPHRHFDVVLLLESLEHVREKAAVLRKLRQVARTLVLRTSCNPSLAIGESRLEFSRSMNITSCAAVAAAAEEAGWKLTAPPVLWGGAEAMETHQYWQRRLNQLAASRDDELHGIESGHGGAHVLQASIEAFAAKSPIPSHAAAEGMALAGWFGRHRMVDLVATNPSWEEGGTCPTAQFFSSEHAQRTFAALGRLIALSSRAISLPTADADVLEALRELHDGSVPANAIGISAKISRAPSGGVEVDGHRYFVYLANSHFLRPPAREAVARAGERIAALLRAPPLVLAWLRAVNDAAKRDGSLPDGLGFGVRRDRAMRLTHAKLYVLNGKAGSLPDLPMQTNASQGGEPQRLSDLLDLASPHQLASLEWAMDTRDSAAPPRLRFRQYRRLPIGPSGEADPTFAQRVIRFLRNGTSLASGGRDETLEDAFRTFAVSTKAEVEVIGASDVEAHGTTPPAFTKLGLLLGKLPDASLRSQLDGLMRRVVGGGTRRGALHANASESLLNEWLDTTAAVSPGKLHIFNLACGLSATGQPYVTVYQLPAVEEGVCSALRPTPAEVAHPALPSAFATAAIPPPTAWPPPPKDVGGAVELLVGGGARGGLHAPHFLSTVYQHSVLHVQRPLDQGYFTDRLLARDQIRALLAAIEREGLLGKAARAHRQSSLLQDVVGGSVTTAELLDLIHEEQRTSIVVTLLATKGEDLRGGGSLRHADTAPALRDLSIDLQSALGVNEVGVNLYLSSAGDQVLPPHTDKYDVFVLQLWGHKRWKTCVPRVLGDVYHDPISGQDVRVGRRFGKDSEDEPILSEAERGELNEVRRHMKDGCSTYAVDDALLNDMSCEERLLGPGDTLYLPKGVVHVAETDAHESAAHLTISLPFKGRTYGDLLSHLVSATFPEGDPARCSHTLAVSNTIENLSKEPAGIGWRKAIPVWLLKQCAPHCEADAAAMRDQVLHLIYSSRAVMHLGEEMPFAAAECKETSAQGNFSAYALYQQLLAPDRFSSSLKLFLQETPPVRAKPGQRCGSGQANTAQTMEEKSMAEFLRAPIVGALAPRLLLCFLTNRSKPAL